MNNKFAKEKNELLSALIKQSSKNKKNYNLEIVKNFIKNIPKIAYVMILLDSSLGPLALSRNKIIRRIIIDKEHTIIEKSQILSLMIFNSIREDPDSLFSLLNSVQLLNRINNMDMSRVNFLNIQALITIIVWFLQMK